MKKGLALIAMLMMAVVMLSGCNLIGYDAELDGAQVVAKVDDAQITKAEWAEYRDYLMAYDQQYMMQNFGFSMPIDEDMVATYGENALEQLIQNVVVEKKLEELGMSPLTEEEATEVDEYATGMVDLYKMLIRMQNHSDIETVEEEQARLAEATPDEANPVEPVATMTDAELDAMLNAELEQIGYTYEYFSETQEVSVLNEKLRAHTGKDVNVTDEQVKTEFDSRVAAQKESYDETPTLYASAVNAGSDVYYTPAGYRGVKHVLVKITDEKQTEINDLNAALTAANASLADGNEQIEALKAEDTSMLNDEGKALYAEQMTALEAQVAAAQATIDETQPKLDAATEAAFAEILPKAEEVLAKAKAGEDFDALVAEYGEDGGMKSEPNMSRGYLVCEGLAQYEQAFQDGAMALENVGEISDLVKTSYGYHILQYTSDIESATVEFTDEIKEDIHEALTEEAEAAAYDAAVAQWVSEAKVETFPKIMK